MVENLSEQLTSLLTNGFIKQFIQFLIWVILILALSWFLKKRITTHISDNSSRYHARKIVTVTSYVLIVILAIISFAGKVQYFTISIGLLSAGIAFTLQEVFLSMAGWFSIFSSKLYAPGDRIEMNGIKGDVIDISFTKTTLMEIGEWVKSDNYSGRIVQLSNAFVFKGPVFNYSNDFPFVWDVIELPIKYGSDVALTQSVIMEIANKSLMEYANFAKADWANMVNKYRIENANVEPSISFKLTDNWILFTLRFVVDYKARRSVKTEIYHEILTAIEKSNGKIKLASATFEVTAVPNINVEMNRK